MCRVLEYIRVAFVIEMNTHITEEKGVGPAVFAWRIQVLECCELNVALSDMMCPGGSEAVFGVTFCNLLACGTCLS